MSSALSSLLLANHKGDASALRLELQDPTKVLAAAKQFRGSLSALAFIAQEVTNEVPVTTAALAEARQRQTANSAAPPSTSASAASRRHPQRRLCHCPRWRGRPPPRPPPPRPPQRPPHARGRRRSRGGHREHARRVVARRLGGVDGGPLDADRRRADAEQHHDPIDLRPRDAAAPQRGGGGRAGVSQGARRPARGARAHGAAGAAGGGHARRRDGGGVAGGEEAGGGGGGVERRAARQVRAGRRLHYGIRRARHFLRRARGPHRRAVAQPDGGDHARALQLDRLGPRLPRGQLRHDDDEQDRVPLRRQARDRPEHAGDPGVAVRAQLHGGWTARNPASPSRSPSSPTRSATST